MIEQINEYQALKEILTKLNLHQLADKVTVEEKKIFFSPDEANHLDGDQKYMLAMVLDLLSFEPAFYGIEINHGVLWRLTPEDRKILGTVISEYSNVNYGG